MQIQMLNQIYEIEFCEQLNISKELWKTWGAEVFLENRFRKINMYVLELL